MASDNVTALMGLNRIARGALICAAVAGEARAEPEGAFGVERFHLAMDDDGLLDVDSAVVPSRYSWGLGAWTGFAHDPLVAYSTTAAPDQRVVGQRLTTGLVGYVALRDRLALGAALDATDYQTGDGIPMALPSGGAGNLRVSAKILVAGAPADRVHVALIAGGSVPLGARGGYLRDAPSLAPEVAATWAGARVRASANLGYRLRRGVDVGGLAVDDELFARAGAGAKLGAGELDASVTAALAPAHLAANTTAVEVLVGGMYAVSSTLRVFAAGGAGLDRGYGTPDWRALAGLRFDRVERDRDGDGILDAVDRCPDEPEDKDGFEDADGCPDPDNDKDGIADARDRCPLEPEDKDGFEDDDGCPDPDNDADGIPDAQDRCPLVAEDKDGIEDEDGCPDAPGKITGQVTSRDGQPIAGATVVLVPVDHPTKPKLEIAASDDGTFAAELDGGAIELTATAPGYQPGVVAASLADGGAVTVAIKLVRVVRQGQLVGQVLSFDGKPLVASIEVIGVGTKTSTNGEGQYTLDLAEGTFEIVIESPGFATQRKSVVVKVDRVTVLNLDMRRTR